MSLNDPELAAKVQEAMSQAVTDCLNRGVSIDDSDMIKLAILEARHRVRTEFGLPDDRE